jgi:toxin ParE1/3/4
LQLGCPHCSGQRKKTRQPRHSRSLIGKAEKAELGFVDALERAYKQISRHPASGSARYAHELDLPGLRSWQLQRYPYLVFYVEQDSQIDVWRVLHQMRDLPSWLSGQNQSKI